MGQEDILQELLNELNNEIGLCAEDLEKRTGLSRGTICKNIQRLMKDDEFKIKVSVIKEGKARKFFYKINENDI